MAISTFRGNGSAGVGEEIARRRAFHHAYRESVDPGRRVETERLTLIDPPVTHRRGILDWS